jgi:hypothetical protein
MVEKIRLDDSQPGKPARGPPGKFRTLVSVLSLCLRFIVQARVARNVTTERLNANLDQTERR